jgi:hypothetical protein
VLVERRNTVNTVMVKGIAKLDEFWLCLHTVAVGLQTGAAEARLDHSALDALRQQFWRFPEVTQKELRREINAVILGLAKLDALLPPGNGPPDENTIKDA